MRAQTVLRTSALTCLLLIPLPATHPQATKDAGKARPQGPAYSTEQSAAVTPDLSARETTLRAGLVQNPQSAALLYSLALVLRLEGSARESLDTYTQAARNRKPTPQELRSVALDYVLLGDFDDAIGWLELAAQSAPNDAEILYSLGRCYYSRDRYVDAGKLYQRVLAIDPHNLKAQENLGLAYDATHRTDKAEEALRTAAAWADPSGSDEWPFLDWGSFLLDQDRAAEAVGPLRVASQIRHDCVPCHERLGRALLATHDTAGGLQELAVATQLDPKNPKMHYEYGRALRQAGQLEHAQQELSLSQTLYSAHSEE